MKLKFIWLILSFGLIFCSCRKRGCNGETEITNYVLTESEKASIPYKGYVVMHFISPFQDTATFYGQGITRQSKHNKKYAGTPDCPLLLVDSFEYLSIDFACNRIPSLKFILEKVFESPYKTTGINISNLHKDAFNSLIYASDSTIITDSIPWNGVYQRGKLLSGPLNVIYNSKIGILKFENNDTLWIRIPNN